MLDEFDEYSRSSDVDLILWLVTSSHTRHGFFTERESFKFKPNIDK